MDLNTPLSQLGGLTAKQFVTEYWHKKPLYIPKACPQFVDLISPDELAGLALESHIESRLIREIPGATGQSEWSLTHGPLTDDIFSTLGNQYWTLLVQAVDQAIPAVSQQLDLFSFIPNWRIDDVMVSFATANGTVGAHYDHYDVFLIQGQGSRRWQIGKKCSINTKLQDNPDLRLIDNMQVTDTFTLNPGDMLYLPPNVAHHGVSIDESTCYSIGFRAPSHADILRELTDFIGETLTDFDRYEDADLAPQIQPGWISHQSIEKIQQMLLDIASDQDQLASWLGQYASLPKYESSMVCEDTLSEEQLRLQFLSGQKVFRDECSRLVYLGDEDRPSQLFINGDRFPLATSQQSICKLITSRRHFEADEIVTLLKSKSDWEWIAALFNQGILYFGE